MFKALRFRFAILALLAVILPACHDSSDDAPLLSLLAMGGNGSNGDGGNGDEIYVYGDYVMGDVSFMKTGTVDAGVSIPNVMPYLGTNPRTVTTATTLVGVLEANTPFDGDVAGAATGLWVRSGATLTLDPNEDPGNTANKTTVFLAFNNGVYIQGTVVINVMTASPDTSLLNLSCQNLVIAPGGSLIVKGADNAGGTGRNGGNSTLNISDTFVNSGTVTTAGGNGDTGGNGGLLDVFAGSYGAFNDGSMISSGGVGLAGFGGSAGYIDLEGDQGGFNNSGIWAMGGNGSLGGGNGNSIYIAANSFGAATNAGTADASGGAATDNGNGGDAGEIDYYAYSGNIRLAGRITALGGRGGPNGGDGGNGNEIYVYAEDDNDYVTEDYFGVGIFIGAEINSSGGDGENGGDAGNFYVEVYSSGDLPVPGFGITFVGYGRFENSGGNGSVNGGDTNEYIEVYSYPVYDENLGVYFGGRIYNEVPMYCRGGNGGTGDGGDAYDIYFYNYQDYSTHGGPVLGIVNKATLDVSGGHGGVNGGDGGWIEMYQYSNNDVPTTEGIVNEGNLIGRGGNGADGNGGDGNYLYMESDYQITNSGSVDFSGGNGGNGFGGDAGYFDAYVYSDGPAFQYAEKFIKNSGSVTLRGGSGTTTGGDGNSFYISSFGSVFNTGGADTSGGNGLTGGGTAGYIDWYSDGVIVNSASLTARGGNTSTGTGGDGDDIILEARLVTNSSALNAGGGNSVSGAGGDGDYIEITSYEGGSVLGGSSLDIRGGSGTPAGTQDFIYIDGITLQNPTAGF